MKNKNFPLKKDLILPRSFDGSADTGYILFPKELFGIGYENYRPSATNQSLGIDLVIRNMATDQTVYMLKQFVVTAEGFQTDTILNKKEIEDFRASKEVIKLKIEDAQSKIEALNMNLQIMEQSLPELIEDPKAADEINNKIAKARKDRRTLQDEKQALHIELQSLIDVKPEFKYTFPYSEVINWFDNQGVLLEQYWADALSISFLGKKASQYVTLDVPTSTPTPEKKP